VPLTEKNPIAAVQTNALATATLAMTAAEFHVSDFVMVSTDKAVDPRSILGASKRVAELALMRWRNPCTTMKSIRLGNVIGSQGSVILAFQQQIAEGGPVTVTHLDANRYFLPMEEAVELILATLGFDGEAKILIPDLGEPVQIVELARRMIQESRLKPEGGIPILLTGLRPGDKISESFVAESETLKPTYDPRLFAINSPEIPRDEFDSLVRELGENAKRRDLPAVVESLCRLVPEYQPSETILHLMCHSSAIEK
jgi:FlaA1/EpsC-like NDP-sugar epimerase